MKESAGNSYSHQNSRIMKYVHPGQPIEDSVKDYFRSWGCREISLFPQITSTEPTAMITLPRVHTMLEAVAEIFLSSFFSCIV